jgi:hypothetical protein
MQTTSRLGVLILDPTRWVNLIDPTRLDPTRPENKWVGYGFIFFDPNRIGLGSDQPDPT